MDWLQNRHFDMSLQEASVLMIPREALQFCMRFSPLLRHLELVEH